MARVISKQQTKKQFSMDPTDTFLTSTSCSLAENSYEKACNSSQPYLVPVVFDKELLEDRDQMECTLDLSSNLYGSLIEPNFQYIIYVSVKCAAL